MDIRDLSEKLTCREFYERETGRIGSANLVIYVDAGGSMINSALALQERGDGGLDLVDDFARTPVEDGDMADEVAASWIEDNV